MNHRCIILGEGSQSQKIAYCMIPFTFNSEKINMWGEETDQ